VKGNRHFGELVLGLTCPALGSAYIDWMPSIT